MKVLTDRLTAISRRIAGAKSFAGDAEVDVLPLLLAVTELPGALRNASPFVAATQEDTWTFVSFPGPLLGIQAAQDLSVFTVGRGLWHLRGFCRHQFAGTVNANSEVFVSLVEPGGNLAAPGIAQFALSSMAFTHTPVDAFIPINQTLNFVDDGWRIYHHTPATVAGDVLASEARIVWNKLL